MNRKMMVVPIEGDAWKIRKRFNSCKIRGCMNDMSLSCRNTCSIQHRHELCRGRHCSKQSSSETKLERMFHAL
jgi:hypothetical protein